nr:hypothetical protein JVH1_3307 [Rhodococcus sp. JVH1]
MPYPSCTNVPILPEIRGFEGMREARGISREWIEGGVRTILRIDI